MGNCPAEKLLQVKTLDAEEIKKGGVAIGAAPAEIDAVADVSAFMAKYTVTAPAAIPTSVRFIELAHASTVIAKTIASLVPYAGQIIVVKNTSSGGTAAHTVTVTTGTWNGTHKVLTLDAPGECIVVAIDSAGNGTVVENVETVGLS